MVQGDIVLVTGAGSGIGLEISKAFAAAGAKVVVTDVCAEAAEVAAAAIRAAGHEAFGMTLNVTDEAQVEAVLKQTVEQFGRLDVLINNAGLQHVSPIEEFPTEKFELMIKIMLTAPFIAIKHAFPIMKEQGYGRILNMASINGLIGFAGKAAYNSAKHGLLGLTKVAALEGAEHGITVNAICPGYVDTPLVR
ncbi:MAG: 3-hydroxybutyrate dehydrogenase, partial [Exiguobacterium acetylicum]